MSGTLRPGTRILDFDARPRPPVSRHYGALTGLDKQETVDKHGIEQVTVWRRSYDIPPPELDKTSEHYPGNDPKYAMLDKACLPTTESLYTTALRVIPYWQSTIVPDIKAGKKVIIAAHGNSLRALVQVRARVLYMTTPRVG